MVWCGAQVGGWSAWSLMDCRPWPDQAWHTLWQHVSCNFLSTYADYYADKDFHHSPEEIFTFAKSLSNKITLRHNYELYEFTIYIYKD